MKRETFAKYLIGMNNSVLPYFFQILYKYLLSSQAQECGGATTTEGHFGVILTAWCVVCCRVPQSYQFAQHLSIYNMQQQGKLPCDTMQEKKKIYIYPVVMTKLEGHWECILCVPGLGSLPEPKHLSCWLWEDPLQESPEIFITCKTH